ncbi:MAG: hypothetical protein WBI17_03340 [Clostridiaceae bacterium]
MLFQSIIDNSSEITKKKALKILHEGGIKKISYTNGFLSSLVDDGLQYKQKIKIENDSIKSYTCSCNTENVMCHHLLAVMMKGSKITDKKTSSPKIPKVSLKNTKSNLTEILNGADKEELIDFILSLRSYYKDIPVIIRKSFISSSDEDFLKANREELLAFYSTLKTTSSSETFSKYFNNLLLLHDRARTESKERNYLRSTLLYMLLYEMVSYPSVGMDHYLFNSHYVRIAQEALLPLSEKKFTPRESQMIFDYLMTISTELKDFSQITTLLQLMKSYITTEKDFDNYYKILLMVAENGDLLPYDRNNLLFLEYELLMMVGRTDAAKELHDENPNVSEFRFMESESLLAKGKVYEALAIVKDGVLHSGSNWDDRIRWLYLEAKIYKLLSSFPELVEVTRNLLALGEYKAYLDLKRIIKTKEWPGIYEKLIEDEEIKKNTKGVYKRIILEEDDKRRLLGFIKENPELIVEHYEFLNPEYDMEASKLLASYIEEYGIRLNGKKDYEYITQLVEKLFIYGQNKIANETIMDLVLKNKSRKALHTMLFQLKDTYAPSGPYVPE